MKAPTYLAINPMGKVPPEGPQARGRTGYASLEDVTRALTGHLARHDFIADHRFTAADVYVGSQVGWGLQFGTIPANDTLVAYWNRIKDRPARLAADAKDNAQTQRSDPWLTCSLRPTAPSSCRPGRNRLGRRAWPRRDPQGDEVPQLLGSLGLHVPRCSAGGKAEPPP
jgi:hypothetical protein